ncbi:MULTISPECIES: NAD-dependent epimerase/dehydratase family protein [Streptomyces]|uniref:Reductase n=1 Tax=Streptomyces venezuelae (strain ATCC 10712 / CBS 650.69 / DSM 40230 / JCM 4526 / NBRC 13096 / PD 04745) TaxID=953739 RepID=F2R402_STRVP|nr:NAD-dependent epimerase/dehydratase family protein [Streptomyces venezuelae]APE23990.1 reductase [Streptomyces venezuelae]QES01358.1 NAD-dependent epimerase/dehydratase family protein [Streptomyces venezuelae ATCC 10712]CCA58374.1 reductase [Streptomyces venezuelae ATCC 10712]
MDILIIGGNRYFGKRLTLRLLESGHDVTMLNRGSSGVPEGVTHLIADRNDENALESALGDRTFDVVIDQVCYTPVQAAIARRVLGPRTRRYVMTSTVEIYEFQHSATPLREDAVDPRTVTVDPGLPWADPEFLETHYGEGKRQAEAVFAAAPAFPYTAVRVAHVLGGADDFTGRIGHYADRIRAGEPIAVPAENHPATYVYVEEIAAFLAWAAENSFTGPVNAHSHGALTTADICAEIERLAGGRTVFQKVEVGEVSPFSFARSYAMDNSRATELGFTFRDSTAWLPQALSETLGTN